MRHRVPAVALLALLLPCPAVQAQRLPGGAVPEHYDLAFDVDLEAARFAGTATVAVRLAAPSTRIVLNAADLTVEAAAVSAGDVEQTARWTLDQKSETLTLTVPRAVPAGPAELRIRYRGVLNDSLRGFYLSRNGGRRFAVTQFESTDARRAFPSFDEPAYKATFSLSVTAPAGATVISNGVALADSPGPGAGRHTVRFSKTPKMSSYLVAVAVGDFACLQGAAARIPIRVCATSDKRAFGQLALDATKQILPYFNRYFSIAYPFEKLDIVAVPDFAAGAMENTAAIFFRESELLTVSASPPASTTRRIWSTLAHEIAHQWFGNLVTMAWWDDLWLNEGLATWMEKRPLAAVRPDWRMDLESVSESQSVMGVDALVSSRAIHTRVETPVEIEDSFDAIVYEKGAAVVRMIEGYVGGSVFRSAVNAYIERHAYGNATSEDFWSVVATVSRKPVDKILPTFVEQAGVPVVDATLRCGAERTELALTAQRFFSGRAAPGSPTWQLPICIRAANTDATSCSVASGPTTTVPLQGQGCPSWVFLNRGGQGYFRTAYAPAMLRALSVDAGTRLTAPERLTLVGDEWELVKAGRHAVSDYLTLVSGFGQERADAVLSEISRRLEYVHAHLTTPASRPAFQRFVQSLYRPIADSLGLHESPGDDDERRTLRATVVSTLGSAGNDPELAREASSLVEAALSGGMPLEATSADTMVALAARRGDAALWQRFFDAAKAASNPADRYRSLYALARFDDPSLVDRGIALALTPDLRSQDTGTYLSRFLSNPAARDRAWAFVKKNWTTLRPKLTVSFGETRLVQGLTSYCDASARDDIRRFFSRNPLRYGARTLEQTLETMSGCIAMQQRATADVAAWLASR